MKKIVCGLAFLFAFFQVGKVFSQNIVPNPSFEDSNTCTEYKSVCSPAAWFNIRRQSSHGYVIVQSDYDAPAASGSKYIAMVAAVRGGKNRHYWETRLLSPLRKGEKYRVTLKLAGSKVG